MVFERAWDLNKNDNEQEQFHIVDLLLKTGANVNIRDTYGHTPLIRAAANRISEFYVSEIIKILLKAGANAKMRDREGKRAIDHARENIGKGTKGFKMLEAASK